MNRAITSFERYALLEKKGDLKKLVGKDADEELTINDAKKIGSKVANMEGEDKKKYVGIINFLGASCNIYNELWKNYKRTRDSKKD
ncbi:hypothetical protein UFOVP1247_233 [uncultured Caudovirales phage]|jgi:hypothetical protein|uniref:Uncharacterized protein n=1 Tax=uncultured Caudovirales phage TaxID=2100421 RepID=A0A6J5RD75_9CAUD|nr:hypothetical protein UFOVP970_273 [uncultured Caudovirales phage]CAB4193862.1 hypothetical protein UFOVP1247_233 [uncultured Caudovirales phage]